LKLGEEFIDILQTQAIPIGRKTAKLQLDEFIPPYTTLQAQAYPPGRTYSSVRNSEQRATKIKAEKRNLSNL
jgi:hypothetical protein